MIKNVKIVIIWAFKSKFYQYFVFNKKYSNNLQKDFNRHQVFPTNKQYVKIKLTQNETNCWFFCEYFNLRKLSRDNNSFLEINIFVERRVS